MRVPQQSAQPRGGTSLPSASVAVRTNQDTTEQLKPLAQLTQKLEQTRSASIMAGRIFKGASILGLSDAMTQELSARLPVREGDALNEGSRERILAAVREFDDHLLTSFIFTGPDALRVQITAPGFAIKTSEMGAKLIKQAKPMYPPEAKMQRIQGTVRLSAVIAADGTVKNLEVISGDPLLSPAAVEAVRQWVYQPTLLNGDPVDVKTEIDVNFTLSH